MGQRRLLVALATSTLALAYVATVHIIAAIKYFDKDK